MAEGQARSWAEVWLEPGVSSGLVLPVETVAVNLLTATLHIDQFGVVTVPLGRGRPANYRVGMMAESSRLMLQDLPPEDRDRAAATSREGVSDRIARLALEVAGSGPPIDQARRIEEHLIRNYRYTLDLVGASSENPVDGFLFESRRGHCEYFASAMVLMLRSLGIPARFATGYLGGEFSPFENYFVVRRATLTPGWKLTFPTEAGPASIRRLQLDDRCRTVPVGLS